MRVMDLAQAAPLYPAAMPAQGNDSPIEVRAFVAHGGARVGGGEFAAHRGAALSSAAEP
jgi:hypothetical protein